MATALYVQFHPQRQLLLALGALWRLFHKALFVSLRSAPNRKASEVLPATTTRPSLLFVLVRRRRRKDARRETTRETRCDSLELCFINMQFSKKSPLALLPHFCAMLARSSKSAGRCVFRIFNSIPFRGRE
jgi:hypothetical protein